MVKKYILLTFLPITLWATEIKKIEWFPTEPKAIDSLNKIPCEEEINPWQIRPWDTGPFNKVEMIKGPRETKTCKFFSLKF